MEDTLTGYADAIAEIKDRSMAQGFDLENQSRADVFLENERPSFILLMVKPGMVKKRQNLKHGARCFPDAIIQSTKAILRMVAAELKYVRDGVSLKTFWPIWAGVLARSILSTVTQTRRAITNQVIVAGQPRREQGANMTTNRHLTANGKTQIMIEWERETGIGEATIRARLKRGWTSDQAVTVPANSFEPLARRVR